MKAFVIGARGQVAEAFSRARRSRSRPPLGVQTSIWRTLRRSQRALDSAKWDVIVNAAAYTAVDKAEIEEAIADKINGKGAGEAAGWRTRAAIPFIHLSTDYVFDGRSDRPYREDDPVNPSGGLWPKQAPGGAPCRSTPPPIRRSCELRGCIPRLGRISSRRCFGWAASNDSVRVVDDQFGSPTSALDMADALLDVARQRLAPDDASLRGIFHMTGQARGVGPTLPKKSSRGGATRVDRRSSVRRITTAEYPTPAARPRNSRLDNTKFAQAFGFSLPDWRPFDARLRGPAAGLSRAAQKGLIMRGIILAGGAALGCIR